MSKRNLIIGVGVVALGIAWYAFRPELLFVNKTVNEELPVAQAGSMSMAKGGPSRGFWRKATSAAWRTRPAAQPRFIRLIDIFLQDADQRRPVFGGTEKFKNDPRWRDLIPFHEYFHDDNGAGMGASHQTGWTGLVAKLIQQYHG